MLISIRVELIRKQSVKEAPPEFGVSTHARIPAALISAAKRVAQARKYFKIVRPVSIGARFEKLRQLRTNKRFLHTTGDTVFTTQTGMAITTIRRNYVRKNPQFYYKFNIF